MRATMDSGTCLDAETLLAVLDGRLPAATRARVDEHLARCRECHARVALASSGGPTVVSPLAPDDSAPASLSTGTLVGDRYRIERWLGGGGMGRVYVARDERLHREVALKLIRSDFASSAAARERFLVEARAVAALTGEHIVRIFDVGECATYGLYIAMELLAGEDGHQHLARRGRLDPATAVVVVVQACEAISEAHASGIIHRDIKPRNIFFVRRSDGATRIKVLDFGLARRLDGGSSELTQSGAIVGTAGYMAPEQLLGRGEVDARADVWALGVTLHELLAGRRPFDDESPQLRNARVLLAEPAELPDDVPEALRAIVRRCLARDAEQRFQTVALLREALLGLGTASSAAKGARGRSRRLLIAGSSLALLAGAAWFGRRLVLPTPQSRHDVPAAGASSAAVVDAAASASSEVADAGAAPPSAASEIPPTSSSSSPSSSSSIVSAAPKSPFTPAAPKGFKGCRCLSPAPKFVALCHREQVANTHCRCAAMDGGLCMTRRTELGCAIEGFASAGAADGQSCAGFDVSNAYVIGHLEGCVPPKVFCENLAYKATAGAKCVGYVQAPGGKVDEVTGTIVCAE